jgi:GTPase SAR1 family protein
MCINSYNFLDKESFTQIPLWWDEVKDLKRVDAIFALVGNKLDLDDKRQVETNEAQTWAKEKNLIFQEVSAKTGQEINTLFYKDIFDQIILKFKQGVEEEQSKFYFFIFFEEEWVFFLKY